MFNQLLPLHWRQPTLLSHNLAQNDVDFACHMSCIAADVKVRLLEQEIVDKDCMFSHFVLDVYLLRGFTIEGSDDF